MMFFVGGCSSRALSLRCGVHGAAVSECLTERRRRSGLAARQATGRRRTLRAGSSCWHASGRARQWPLSAALFRRGCPASSSVSGCSRFSPTLLAGSAVCPGQQHVGDLRVSRLQPGSALLHLLTHRARAIHDKTDARKNRAHPFVVTVEESGIGSGDEGVLGGVGVDENEYDGPIATSTSCRLIAPRRPATAPHRGHSSLSRSSLGRRRSWSCAPTHCNIDHRTPHTRGM
jgi:hypothetical protein